MAGSRSDDFTVRETTRTVSRDEARLPGVSTGGENESEFRILCSTSSVFHSCWFRWGIIEEFRAFVAEEGPPSTDGDER